jgi:cytochrome c-type biogenesis protein CcmH
MTIWLFALILTAIACATLYYAGAGRTVNAGTSVADATQEHFRAQLRAIDTDAAAGRLGVAEATAAKAELAREVIRSRDARPDAARRGSSAAVWVPVALIAVLSLGTYHYLGRPDLPAEPLAGRTAETGAGIDLDAALKTIEARLAANPDDLKGWQVIAPAYMQMGRYADAVKALRRVNALQTPTAQTQNDLGEALMMANGGSVAGEPLQLFRNAATLDPKDVRSRFYVAGEETRVGDYQHAIPDWTALLALAKRDEPWVVTAKNGLAFAQQGLHPETAPSSQSPADATVAAMPDQDQIASMVDGLETRLKASGGSIDEWTQLVRSRMVQGKMDVAQADYDLARKAYPDAKVRTELDVLAADNGLSAK